MDRHAPSVLAMTSGVVMDRRGAAMRHLAMTSGGRAASLRGGHRRSNPWCGVVVDRHAPSVLAMTSGVVMDRHAPSVLAMTSGVAAYGSPRREIRTKGVQFLK